jgi:hypothetical protein
LSRRLAGFAAPATTLRSCARFVLAAVSRTCSIAVGAAGASSANHSIAAWAAGQPNTLGSPIENGMSRQRSSNAMSAHRYFNIHDRALVPVSNLVVIDELTECRTSVENLSRDIEKYFDTPTLYRTTHPHRFALLLKGLIPRRPCPYDLVNDALKANTYLERAESGYMASLGHSVSYKFGNSIAFIWIVWSKESGRFIEKTMNGIWKKSKEDFR